MMTMRGNRARRAAALLAALCFAQGLAACGDDSIQDQSAPLRDGGGDGATRDAGDAGASSPDDPCADDDAGGSACGDDRHCIDGRCVENLCGDGVKAGTEACDDGNDAIGDGCDPACRMEAGPSCGDGEVQDGEECDDGNRYDADGCTTACIANECGNERIDGSEECDDGNTIDDDMCSNACLEVRCRNGRVDPGEECDDGNRIHDDGCTNACEIVICGNGEKEGDEECDDGNGADEDACANACLANVCGNARLDPGEVCDGGPTCSADCSEMVEDLCRPCEELLCSDYLQTDGYDVISGCFDAGPTGTQVRTDFGAVFDATFIQNCVDAVACARQTGCGVDPERIGLDCYCGSITTDQCNIDGPAADAPCVTEWQDATRGPTNIDVLLWFADVTYPSGWAYSVLECDATVCRTDCVR